jgi:DNA-binding XRE family transcriptional regulator
MMMMAGTPADIGAEAARMDDATRLFSQPHALTDWRARFGYSQRQAADAIGCSRGAWAGWEAGKQPIPKYISLAIAALSLGVRQ